MATIAQLVVELRANHAQLTASLNSVQQQLGTLGSQAQQQQRRVNQAFDGMGDAAKRFGDIVKTYVGVQTIKAIAETGMAFDRVNNQFKAATGTSAGAAREMAFLREETNRLGLNTLDTANAYGKLLAAAQGTALQGKAVRDIFSSVAEASSVMGLSAEDTTGTIRALEQMISKGTVQAEEFKGQLGDRIPGAMKIAADATGKTTQQLMQMMQNGEILSEDFLPKFAAALKKHFAGGVEDASNSARASFMRFQNSYQEVMNSVAQSGLLEGLAHAADQFGESIRDIEPALKSLGKVAGEVITLIADRLASGLKVASTLANAISLGAGTLAIRNQELLGLIDHDVAEEALKDLRAEFTGVGKAAADASSGVEGFSGKGGKGLGTLSKEAEKAKKAADDLQFKLDDLQRAARLDAMKTGDDELTQALYEVHAAVADVAAQYEKATGKIFRFTAAQHAQIETIKETRQQTVAWNQIQQAIDDTRTPLEKYRIETEKLEKLKPFAETPEALDAIQRKMEQLGEETNKQAEIFKDFAKDMGDSTADVIEHLIDRDFDGMFDSVYDAFKEMLARMATLAIAQPIIIPMVTAVGGALGLSQGTVNGITQQLGGNPLSLASTGANAFGLTGGINAAINGFGAQTLGMPVYNAAIGPTLSGAPMAAGGTAGLSSVLGAAGLGYLGGSMLGDMLGLNSTGSGLGGAAGAGLGMYLGSLGSLGGPLGALAGGAVGTLVGGLFGGNSRPHPASTFGTQGVFASPLDLQSKHMDTEFASTLAAALKQALGSLSGAGLDLSFIKSLQGGVNDGKGFLSFGDSSINNPLDTANFDPKNPDSGLAKFLSLVVNQVGDLSKVMDADLIPALRNLSTEGKTSAEVLNEIVAALTRDDQRKAFLDGINNSILDMVLPGFSAMNQEMAQFAANMAQAKALGLSQAQIAQVTELHQLRVRQLQSQNNQAQQKALQTATSLVQKYGSLAGGFGSLLDQLRNGKYTTLTPVANLADLRSQVLSTGAAARLGDADAQERLLSLLPQFLDLSAQVNGYSVEFAKDQGIATDLAEAAKSVAERQLGIQQAILDQATQTNALLSGMGGTPISGGNANDKLVAALNGGYSLSNDLIDTIFNSAGVTVAPGEGRRTNFLNNPANSGINASLNAAFHALGVPGFAGGGWIRGGIPGMDSVPTLHMPDEFTLRAASARSIGAPALEFMNRTGRLPANDNSGEIAALRQDVQRLTAVVAAGQREGNDHLAGIRTSSARTANGVAAGIW